MAPAQIPNYNLRRSQRVASSSQTPLRNEIKSNNHSNFNITNNESSSPIKKYKNSPIKPQISYTTNDATPFVRKQLLLSEDEDHIFQSTKLNVNNNEINNTKPLLNVKSTNKQIQDLMMMETPSRIRNLIEKITPRGISKRIFLNIKENDYCVTAPSSPLLSIPTVKVSKHKDALLNQTNNSEKQTDAEAGPNKVVSLLIWMILFIPKFCWNNFQTFIKIGHFVFVLPFLKIQSFIFDDQNNIKSPKKRKMASPGKRQGEELPDYKYNYSWIILSSSILFIFLLGIRK